MESSSLLAVTPDIKIRISPNFEGLIEIRLQTSPQLSKTVKLLTYCILKLLVADTTWQLEQATEKSESWFNDLDSSISKLASESTIDNEIVVVK